MAIEYEKMTRVSRIKIDALPELLLLFASFIMLGGAVQTVIDFWDGAGWLANLAGILTFVVAIALAFYRWGIPYTKPSNIGQIIPLGFAVSWSPSKAKSWARIAIVDDEPADFPVSDLESDGYQICVYESVTLATTTELSRYDIIFLDMKGVVKDDPDVGGGLKLIAALRNANAEQKICAVSSQRFDPTATEFFKRANDYKKKPLTAQECRTVIENFFADLFSAYKISSDAQNALTLLNRRRRVAALQEVQQYLKGRFDASQLHKRFLSLGLASTSADSLVTIALAVKHDA